MCTFFLVQLRKAKSEIPDEVRFILRSFGMHDAQRYVRDTSNIHFVPFRDCNIPKGSRQNRVNVVVTLQTRFETEAGTLTVRYPGNSRIPLSLSNPLYTSSYATLYICPAEHSFKLFSNLTFNIWINNATERIYVKSVLRKKS